MEFITILPQTHKQHDSIIVVIDKLTKAAHFILVQPTYKATQIVYIFMREIFKFHGILKVVISNRDPKFSSIFWNSLFSGLGTIDGVGCCQELGISPV